MTHSQLVDDIRAFAAVNSKTGAHYATGLAGLSVLCDDAPGGFDAMIYDPVVCLVLQGCKETRLGDRTVRFGAGDSLIVSHSLPVVAAVTEASPDAPYVAMILAVDLGIARSLYDEIGDFGPDDREGQSLVASKTSPELIDAFARLFRASRDPVEAEALAPLIVREIHFRLLQADHGAMLRRMLWRDSAASKVGRVMARMRANLGEAMSVAEMAAMAGMSVSAFHEHFRTIAGTSPLQYLKNLRLTEARRLLFQTAGPVSSIAFDVGYESPTQFSREYARKFGASPRQDLARTKAA
ncbi:MAG: AraC family transcriptional regulator [Maritimibacter sp.]|nr:AraC family transcriptional regulator [Maritimibacter sp.]